MRAYLCPGPAVSRFLSRFLQPTVVATAVFAFALAPVVAQQSRSTSAVQKPTFSRAPITLPGHVIIPASSLPQKGETGIRMHTNIRIFMPDGGMPDVVSPPYSGYLWNTPQSLACRYVLVGTVSGCNPNSTVNTPSGGSQTIAIVDAYDDPSIYGDLAYFCAQMGIPFNPSNFSVVYASGYEPDVDPTGGWELEAALDVEYAHAMAPNAKIVLVEANSNSIGDLLQGVLTATNLVQCNSTSTCSSVTGKGEVSMSWGGAEYSTESYNDSLFNNTNVVYVASAGDVPGVQYPAASPDVISVGGTSIGRNLTTGNYQWEVAWQSTGGGVSQYESLPTFQSAAGLTGNNRLVPDVAANADPNTGDWVFDSFPYDGFYNDGPYQSAWFVVGGTSAATAVWSGIINRAGSFAASSTAELTKLYTDMTGASYSSDFTDIGYGTCGPVDAYQAGTKYDNCTGIGIPKNYTGK